MTSKAIAGGARMVSLDAADLRAAGLILCAASVLLPAVPGYEGTTCPLRATTGVPCPLCGMTTSVRASLRGDLGLAWAANPGGIAAVLLSALLLVTRRRSIGVPAWAAPLGLSALWLFELNRFSLL